MKYFRNFIKTFQQFVFFVQMREKLTHGLLNFLKNLTNHLRKILKTFDNSPASVAPPVSALMKKVLATPMPGEKQ